MSPYPPAIKYFTAISILHLIAGLIQIFYYPVVSLCDGIGYDGIWYIEKAVDINRKVDNYHIFRILPSYICYYVLHFTGLEKSWPNAINIFQYINLLAIQVFVWSTYSLTRILNLPLKSALMMALLALFNFNFSREAYFNPVMTDTVGAMLTMLLLTLYLQKKYWLAFVVGALLFFTYSFSLMVFLLYITFDRENNLIDKTYKQWKIWIYSFAGVAFVLPSVYWFYIRHRLTVYTFPDSILPELYPFSLLVNSLFVVVFFGALWKMFVPPGLMKILKEKLFNASGLLLLVAVVLIKKVLEVLNNREKMNELHILLGNYWTYSNLKPLIGVVDSIQFFGLAVMILLFMLLSITRRITNYGHLVLIFFILFLILMPEARHSLITLPFVLFILFRYIDFSGVKSSFIAFTLIFIAIVSKYYYPLHLAEFPPCHLLFPPDTDEAIYQQFPAQHFFMFSGVTISHANYYIFAGVILLLAIALFFLKNQLKLNDRPHLNIPPEPNGYTS